ncbi:MAG: HAD family phosphatase [Bacteroidaceae bacterium]|nr:HAD family phosphatase [Bacteroidaceae bacterium]
MIRNIAFDFGGVLFDLAYEGAIETFRAIGLEDADQRLDRYHQRGVFELLESGRISADDFRHELEQLCHRELTYEEVLGAWLGYVGAPMDEEKLKDLDQLRQEGFRTFLLSNTNPYVQSWAESADFSRSHRPLSSYLEKCYTSYEVGIMKPDPAIFQFMLNDAAIEPAETIFLDDSPANIQAASALGIQTMLVEKNQPWMQNLRKRLEEGK